MELYLIRHGETDWNVQGRLQGREDIPLNENGKMQAAACSAALAGVDFSVIYSSPLFRARETAEKIASYHSCEITLSPLLMERDYGRLSGMTLAQRERWQARGLPDEVETWDSLAFRAMTALENCEVVLGAADRAALVSHGAWINAVLAVLSGHSIGTGKTRLKNACISVLHKERSGWEIVCYNLAPDEYTRWATKP